LFKPDFPQEAKRHARETLETEPTKPKFREFKI